MAEGRTWKRVLLFRSALVFGSLLFALLCAEGAVRIFFKKDVDTDLLMRRIRERSVKNFLQPSRDPSIYLELKPFVNMNFCGGVIVTDEHGDRIPTRPVKVPNNAVRLAALGDSSSFGWGVDYEDTYPSIYRDRMMADTKTPIALKNFSVPTYNTEQEFHVFKKRVLPYKPDLLILHHDHNDPMPRHSLRSDLHPTFGDNVLHSALVKYVMRRFKYFHAMANPDYNKDAHEFMGPHTVSGPLYDEHLVILKELAELARANRIPVIVVLFNAVIEANEGYRNSPEYLSLHKSLADKLAEMGYYVLDLYPLYQDKMKKEGWSDLTNWWLVKENSADRHPNPAGHRFIADALVTFTKRHPDLVKVLTRR